MHGARGFWIATESDILFQLIPMGNRREYVSGTVPKFTKRTILLIQQ